MRKSNFGATKMFSVFFSIVPIIAVYLQNAKAKFHKVV